MALVTRMRLPEWRALTEKEWLLNLLGGKPTASGVPVDEDRALASVTVLSCVRVIAETISTLPLITYERLERGRRRATDSPWYPILHDRPNPEMSAVEFWDAIFGHAVLRGNAFANLDWLENGAAWLWPLRPDRMRVERVGGRLLYFYTLPSGEVRSLTADGPRPSVWHLRGFSSDGIMGYSPIALAREAVGLSLAAEKFGAAFFGNGSRLSGFLQLKGQLSEAAAKRLKSEWEALHRGLENAHRIAVLEEGVSWQQIGVAPEDAQFLETRKFERTEIASLFRVPPHKVGDLERATFSNIEHQAIEFVQDTIRPWARRGEAALKRLITEDRLFAEWLLDALLRGDTESRYRAYSVGRQWGWLSANDVREKENENPIAGGDVYLVPMNMVPASSAEPEVQTAGFREQRTLRGRRRLRRAYHPLFRDLAARVLRRERRDVLDQAEKLIGRRGLPDFVLWLERYERDELRTFIEQAAAPIFTGYGLAVEAETLAELGLNALPSSDLDEFLRSYVAAAASSYVERSIAQLRQVLRLAEEAGADPLTALERRLDEWAERRPGKLADIESVRTGEAVAKRTYGNAGVRRLRWVASGRNCPYCSDLNGRVVGIEQDFLDVGDFHPKGADRPLTVRHRIGHAPAHGGCDCAIVAA